MRENRERQALQIIMAIPKKIRSSPLLLLGGVSLFCAFLVLETQKPWLDEGSRISPDTSRKVSLLTSPSREDRLNRERSSTDLSAAAEEAFLSLLSNPTDSELEANLIRALAVWAAHDLQAVYNWFGEDDMKVPKNHRWLGDVLVELAKTQPRKALEFGIALNEANGITYDVPPEDLLTISVRYPDSGGRDSGHESTGPRWTRYHKSIPLQYCALQLGFRFRETK